MYFKNEFYDIWIMFNKVFIFRKLLELLVYCGRLKVVIYFFLCRVLVYLFYYCD